MLGISIKEGGAVWDEDDHDMPFFDAYPTDADVEDNVGTIGDIRSYLGL